MSFRLPSGVLAVDKPEGPSSREAVNAVVRGLGLRRVGHAGTLDPFARGLLLIPFGRATGLVAYLQDYPKTYRAEIRFGRVTDTQDRTGTVLEEHPGDGLTRTAVEEALPRFRGRILQVPPAFSALKHEGRRMYRLAREGTVVDRPPREQEVERFEILEWEPPVARMLVVCSKGTYVRTLAHDLGRAVGVGASLDALERVAIGPFLAGSALPLDRIGRMTREELLAAAIDPAEALPDWPSIVVSGPEARAVVTGSWSDPDRRAPDPIGYRLRDADGRLLALARGGPEVRLLRVFVGEGE